MRHSNYLSANLVKLRKATGKSQEDMSWYLQEKGFEVHRSTYGAYEQSRFEPQIGIIKELADYFKVTIEELVFKRL